MSGPRFALASASAAFFAIFASELRAGGQSIEVGRAQTFVVGASPNSDRGNGSTTAGAGAGTREGGRARVDSGRLPVGHLIVEWRTPLGIPLRRAPVIGPDGEVYVAGAGGEVVTLASDGTERARVSTGASDPSPLAILAAGDIVFVDEAGEAIGVRGGRTSFHTRFGRAGSVGPAPLALEDGGAIVATEHEVAVLDAAGGVRSRTTLADAIRAPLVATGGHVLAIGSRGTVWSWVPGALEPERIGSFGGPIDGAAALAPDGTLVAALPEQGLIVALDLARRSSSVRATTSEGLWLGPPSIIGNLTLVPLVTTSADVVVGLDPHGNEVSRTILGGRAAAKGGVDGGTLSLAASFAPPPHPPPLADAWGTFFFATPSGDIGSAGDVRSPNASVELLSDVCGAREAPRAGRTPDPPVVGLVAAAGSVVAACANGTVLAIRAAPTE